jgi:hypothetical protein
VPLAWRCLKAGGELFLWLGHRQASEIGYVEGRMTEVRRLVVPGGGQGEIWWGKKSG